MLLHLQSVTTDTLTIPLKDAVDESYTHFLFVDVPKIYLQTLILLEG